MTRLYNRALDYLKHRFPADFHKFKTLNAFVPEGFLLNHAIGVVNLARLTGESTLLPTAFLACIHLEGSVLRGYE